MEKEIELLQNILKEDPSNFQARRELAILLVNEGFNEEAETNLKYLIKYFPKDEELHYNLGIVYEKLKQFNRARDSYQKAIKLSPQEDFYYNLGEVFIELEKWDDAINSFLKVLETDPNDGNSYFNLGICYYKKEEKNLALDNFQKAVEKNPKDVYAYFYLGYLYQNDGLTNFAIDSYKKVLEVSPDYSWAYFNLGAIAFKNGNLEEARMYLAKTIEYNPRDIEAYKLLTQICLKDGFIDDILEILNIQLEKESNGDLHYCLARVYKYVGDLRKYYEHLQKALQNPYTLSFAKNIIKQEIELAQFKLEQDENLEPETQIEEYNYDDNEQDFVVESEHSDDEPVEEDYEVIDEDANLFQQDETEEYENIDEYDTIEDDSEEIDE